MCNSQYESNVVHILSKKGMRSDLAACGKNVSIGMLATQMAACFTLEWEVFVQRGDNTPCPICALALHSHPERFYVDRAEAIRGSGMAPRKEVNYAK